MWIDFNLYFYVRIHKNGNNKLQLQLVVNWFQFVFLREDSQDYVNKNTNIFSCELISICIFTWGFTSFAGVNVEFQQLWIDFNLYFYVRIHKPFVASELLIFVVNWFQFVFLREDSQVLLRRFQRTHSCELISICIFTWGFTSKVCSYKVCFLLWIDFNLYFYVRIHKPFVASELLIFVVNWFQFVFLREDSQVLLRRFQRTHSCELISICIFTWGFTSKVCSYKVCFLLWIDFNLYFYVRIHKPNGFRWSLQLVVNWFQFVFLREDSQE